MDAAVMQTALVAVVSGFVALLLYRGGAARGALGQRPSDEDDDIEDVEIEGVHEVEFFGHTSAIGELEEVRVAGLPMLRLTDEDGEERTFPARAVFRMTKLAKEREDDEEREPPAGQPNYAAEGADDGARDSFPDGFQDPESREDDEEEPTSVPPRLAS